MGEQPPWNPYGQQVPGQWQSQQTYSPQRRHGQQQPYPRQPPSLKTHYGEHRCHQAQPYGQQPWPSSPLSGRGGGPWRGGTRYCNHPSSLPASLTALDEHELVRPYA